MMKKNDINISKEEQAFYDYWKAHRKKKKKIYNQLLWGIPSGGLFAGTILLSWVSGWNKQVYKVPISLFITIIIGLLGIAIFWALIKMQLDWDKKEQWFKILHKKIHNT